MPRRRSEASSLTLGIDAGGTWIRIASCSPTVRHARQPAVSDAGLSSIVRRVLRSWRHKPSELTAVVVAARGIWTPGERRRLERDLHRLARRVRVMSDAEAAHLGALGGGAGVLILAGTGSIAIGRGSAGAWARAGGLGPLLGDEGSAFWIGREWLRASAAAHDGERLRAVGRGPAAVARIAALAPRVLDRARRRDRLARRIVRTAQRGLALLIQRVARRLALRPPVRVSWAGSLLTRSAWFRSGVARELARAGLRAHWVTPQESADRAAARLAQMLGGHSSGGRATALTPREGSRPRRRRAKPGRHRGRRQGRAAAGSGLIDDGRRTRGTRPAR
jgi:glucosamine kinase